MRRPLRTAPRDGTHIWVKQAGDNALAGEARWLPEYAAFGLIKYGCVEYATVTDGWWWPLPE